MHLCTPETGYIVCLLSRIFRLSRIKNY